MKNKKTKIKAKGSNSLNTKSSFTSTILGTIVVIVACLIGTTYYQSAFKTTYDSHIVTVKDDVKWSTNETCSKDYKDHPVFEGCTPTTTCGRMVVDNVVSSKEVDYLSEIARRGFSHGGSSGGASILDLHSGALSMGEKFVNIFKFLEPNILEETFRDKDFAFYSIVRSRVHLIIAKEFGIDASKLYLTHPTFFSSITNTSAKTQHDEYWHKHIDKIQYGSFDYTSLLYLTDYNTDFTGGRFIFDDEKRVIVEPKRGRLSFFTSGSENPHHVEKVESGVRYAITISFTCDPKKAINDPSLKK